MHSLKNILGFIHKTMLIFEYKCLTLYPFAFFLRKITLKKSKASNINYKSVFIN